MYLSSNTSVTSLTNSPPNQIKNKSKIHHRVIIEETSGGGAGTKNKYNNKINERDKTEWQKFLIIRVRRIKNKHLERQQLIEVGHAPRTKMKDVRQQQQPPPPPSSQQPLPLPYQHNNNNHQIIKGKEKNQKIKKKEAIQIWHRPGIKHKKQTRILRNLKNREKVGEQKRKEERKRKRKRKRKEREEKQGKGEGEGKEKLENKILIN